MITDLTTFLPLFAQAAEGGAPGGAGGAGGNMMSMFMILGLVMVFFWFFILRPQQKQEDKHRKMIDSLDRNDRVYTVGGMIGTIHSIDKDKNEIVLKVDDSNGTKIRFLVSAVAAKIPKDSEKSES